MTPDAASRPPASPWSQRRRAVEMAVLVAFFTFLVWALVRQWPRVEAEIGRLSAAAITGSGAAAIAGIWCSLLCWRALLADFGSPIPVTGAMRVFFVGQAGKYLPGKIWPIVAQVRLGRDYQVPGRSSAAAVMVFMLIVLGSALLVGVCSLPILGADRLASYWWALPALPVAAVVLWPPVLNRLLTWAMRLARRDPMPRPLSAAGISRAVGWALAMWFLYGVHLWILLSALGADAPNLLFRSIGAFAAAWAIGFLTIVAPVGFGPREFAMVLLLSTSLAQPAALVAAVVSRLLLSMGDLAWAVVAILLVRRRRPAPVVTAPDGV